MGYRAQDSGSDPACVLLTACSDNSKPLLDKTLLQDGRRQPDLVEGLLAPVRHPVIQLLESYIKMPLNYHSKGLSLLSTGT